MVSADFSLSFILHHLFNQSWFFCWSLFISFLLLYFLYLFIVFFMVHHLILNPLSSNYSTNKTLAVDQCSHPLLLHTDYGTQLKLFALDPLSCLLISLCLLAPSVSLTGSSSSCHPLTVKSFLRVSLATSLTALCILESSHQLPLYLLR